MKLLAAGAASLLIGVSLIPAVLAGGDTPPPAVCGIAAGPIGLILETIRAVEANGSYQAESAGSSASGAYQFTDGTWNGYGGYTHAASAPPATQDAKATEHVNEILAGHGGDVTVVPVIWYLGHLPELGDPEWDTIPKPDAGNTLTPRQYQSKWMTIYNDLLAKSPPPASTTALAPSTTTALPMPGGCIGGQIEPIDGDWSLPGPRALLTPEAARQPHHDYPAWDWPIHENTPIYNIHTGTVVAVRTWAHNWWNEGCDTGGKSGCDTCGVGVTIVDADGVRWTYCHGNNLTVSLGDHVPAGHQILWSGNTGRSGAPHVHVEIRVRGTRRCPQPLIRALLDSSMISAEELPRQGCAL